MFAAAVLVSSWDESAENTWRSELCPADWTAAFTTPDGRFLHDFSYAGYRLGQEPRGLVGNTFDPVKLHKADPTGKTDAQPAIQDTIRAVQQAGGGTVALPAGIFRCDDVLRISTSNVVLRGAGPGHTRLFFTSVPTRRQRDHILVTVECGLGTLSRLQPTRRTAALCGGSRRAGAATGIPDRMSASVGR